MYEIVFPKYSWILQNYHRNILRHSQALFYNSHGTEGNSSSFPGIDT